MRQFEIQISPHVSSTRTSELMAQKTGTQIHAHDLVPGNHIMIKSQKKSILEGFDFKIVTIIAKQTTSKADHHEISFKIN